MENFDYKQYLTENKLFQEYWSSDDEAAAQAYQEAEKKLANDFISWAKQNEGSREAPRQGTFFGDETLGDSAEIDGQETYWNLCKSGLWKISQWQVPGIASSKGDWCSIFSCTFPEILDAIKSLYRNGIQTQNNNMKEFNYREYLSEGWMFRESNMSGNSIQSLLQELEEILNWSGETQYTFAGKGEGALITVNVDSMGYFHSEEEFEEVKQFAQQNSIDVIPFFCVLGETDDYNEYDIQASGFAIRKSNKPVVVEDGEEISELGMPALEKFIETNVTLDGNDW